MVVAALRGVVRAAGHTPRTVSLRAFATSDPLDPAAVPLRSLPRPSQLERRLEIKPPRAQKALDALGIATVGHLLEHLPFRAEQRDAKPIAELMEGEEATIIGEVRRIAKRSARRRRMTLVEATVGDDSGMVKVTWFNQPWGVERFPPGTRLVLHGRYGGRQSFTPRETHAAGDVAAEGLVSAYPATKGIDSTRLRELVHAERRHVHDVVEPLPARLRVAEQLADRPAALAAAHFPEGEDHADQARRRLAFEELFLLELALAARKRARREGARAAQLQPSGELVQPWLETLPFAPTDDQRAAFEATDGDLAGERPMQRLLMGEVGSGKAQPLDALVLTPTGFRRMGEIRVGDAVINPTGERTTVTGVFPQGVREVWRVHFSDGSSVECDADHLWQVQTSAARSRGETPKVKSLREIAADLRQASGAAKWHVELAAAADLEGGEERPIDGYLLGLLLGDGGLTLTDRVRFTSADQELIDAVRELLPPDCRMSRSVSRPYDWSLVGPARRLPTAELDSARSDDPAPLARAYRGGASHETIARRVGVSGATVRRRLIAAGVTMRQPHLSPTPIAAALASLGLLGKGSRDKFVPPSYLNAPVHIRHAVLQGLMDTDGTLDVKGYSISFCSASRQLADDVTWLARSLGGRARCRPRRKAGGTYWEARMALPAELPPFRLMRKAGRLRPRRKYGRPAKAIVRVEEVGRKPVQCISVAHPNKLYVTDEFTVTHNTVVALHAMLRAVENGRQAALMAPTETLAEQHMLTLDRLLGGMVPIALLTGSTPVARRRDLLGQLASGELGLLVGTHALIEPAVEFRSLALYVVDEQHRFGVRQRAALDAKAPDGLVPHALHMTATPIPRTLALTVYGDLDATAIHQLPAGRKPVETHVVDGARARARAYERIREEIAGGRQCFVVCPLVEESEALQAKAATLEAQRLAATEFKDHRVELIHGQMPTKDKQAAMAAFAAGEADVLVATSVIEVGIDVPNATVMLIEEAERYGISQLHQLRGRVGRGGHASVCILFGSPQNPRLAALANERDGFRLAEIDLKLRGAGEILGTRQHGIPEFKVARLPDDTPLLERVREHAEALLAADPRLEEPEHGLLRAAAVARFGPDLDPIPA